jgi:hypothetical protein
MLSTKRNRIESLDDSLVRRLQGARGYPSVSVLMTTMPGASLASKDIARLARLVDAAERRLAAEMPFAHADGVVDRLRSIAVDARRHPAGRALALYASPYDSALVRVPVPVADRVVIDPTFATRDLVRALALRPRFRVLVVSERAARILEGWTGQLGEVWRTNFAQSRSAAVERRDRARRFGRERNDRRRTRAPAHVREVAGALSVRQGGEPLPLIVAGVTRQLASWQAMAGVGDAIVGTIAGSHDRTPIARLDVLAKPVLESHLRRIRRTALDRLTAEDPARCAFGIQAVWAAAVTGRLRLLCVEDGFVFPARPVGSRGRLQPVKHAEGADVLDDAVDEVIELASLAGAEVVVVHDGALERCGHVAAVVRPR